jgi:hypothetical protein
MNNNETDKDSVISSLQKENKRLKEVLHNIPRWIVTIYDISLNPSNSSQLITIEFSSGFRKSLVMNEEEFIALGCPEVGSKLNLFLFPMRHFSNTGFFEK